MYNKLNANYKKKHIYNFEDEPPAKKLISDGDILIKQLAKKQRNTRLDLEEQLTAKSHFYKSTEEVSVTSYTSGSLSLTEFNLILQYSDNVEKLKSCGLSNEEIGLLFDLKSGKEYLKNKHKNMNESTLKDRLVEILNKIKQSKNEEKTEVMKTNRLKTELTLATKPASMETKLLKFALENQQNHQETFPSPMDKIKDVEDQLMNNISPLDIKKIRKKARRLGKQIEMINNSAPNESVITVPKAGQQNILGVLSKWDMKEVHSDSVSKETKVYTCKPQNLYTIKDGQIIKINPAMTSEDNIRHNFTDKLSLEEIKKIPKFENYDQGTPSKVLYLKNLPNGVTESDLHTILGEFFQHSVSVNIMKGRMRGQAFIEFVDVQCAGKVLNQCNGIVFKNKPIIIQYGKGKCS